MKKLSVMAVLGILCAALFCCHYASDYRVRVRRFVGSISNQCSWGGNPTVFPMRAASDVILI